MKFPANSSNTVWHPAETTDHGLKVEVRATQWINGETSLGDYSTLHIVLGRHESTHYAPITARAMLASLVASATAALRDFDEAVSDHATDPDTDVDAYGGEGVTRAS